MIEPSFVGEPRSGTDLLAVTLLLERCNVRDGLTVAGFPPDVIGWIETVVLSDPHPYLTVAMRQLDS